MGGPTEAKGSAGAIQPASRATATSPQVSTTPTRPLPLRRTRMSPLRPSEARRPGASAGWLLISNAGVESGIDEIGDQVGQDDSDGHDQEHAEQDRIVP